MLFLCLPSHQKPLSYFGALCSDGSFFPGLALAQVEPDDLSFPYATRLPMLFLMLHFIPSLCHPSGPLVAQGLCPALSQSPCLLMEIPLEKLHLQLLLKPDA